MNNIPLLGRTDDTHSYHLVDVFRAVSSIALSETAETNDDIIRSVSLDDILVDKL